MRARRWIPTSALILAAWLASSAAGQRPPGRIAVWDTTVASARPLSPQDVADRDRWRKLSRNERAASFSGDAVISNGRILAVVRRRAPSVDIYAAAADGPVRRAQAQLQAANGEQAARLERVALVEHTRAAARLEAVYQTASGKSLTASFRIKRGEIFVEVAPGAGAGQLQVEAPGRYVVLPDFFADDILIDARQIPAPAVELPSENFLLHLTGGGDSIAMCVFENSDQDVAVTFAGSGSQRQATASEIRFGKKGGEKGNQAGGKAGGKAGRVWVALMEGRGIWHALDVAREDAGQIISLDWKTPFPAQWRTDFTRRNSLTDSWEMLYPDPQGDGYIKPSWLPGERGGRPSLTATGEIDVDAYKVGGPASNRLGPDRQRWITVLGRYHYPCWTDRRRQGHVQPLKHKRDELMFEGPAVIYPINRLPDTPIDTYTTVDVVRSTLGVGPCEYILNVEGQRQDHVGRATCHVRRLLNEIYENQQQKSKRKEIEIYLGDALDFVEHIRDRIELYVEFGRDMRDYLAAQKKAHPELKKPLTEMENLVAELDQRLEDRREGIKSPEYVVTLNQGFRQNLLNYEGPDAQKRLKKYTDALTAVGGSQDTLVGECRWIVRMLRQRAALAMATDPELAEIAKEIRDRTQKVLLKPSAYEGARH